MNIVDYDGFDIYNGVGAAPGIQMEWTLVGGGTGGSCSLVAGRFSGQAIHLVGAGANSWGGYQKGIKGGPYASGTVRFGWKPSAVGALGVIPFALISGAQQMIGLRANANSGIDIYVGGTVVASSVNNAIILGNYYSFEVEYNISDTLGFVRAYLEGIVTPIVSFGNASGAGNADTKPSTQTSCDTIRFSSAGNAFGDTHDFDDYSFDTDTGVRKCFRVRWFAPTADTGVKSFVPSTGANNAALVDDVTINTADYVTGSVVGDADEYDMADITDNPSEIAAVKGVNVGLKTDAAIRSLYNGLDSAGTDSNGAAQPLLTSLARFDRIMQTDPTTAAAWTKLLFNALKKRNEVAV